MRSEIVHIELDKKCMSVKGRRGWRTLGEYDG